MKKRPEAAQALKENCTMPDLPSSPKSVITVSEMAELCQLSRSRFYDLIDAGVFPSPTQHPSSQRPMYDRALQEKCLEIRATGIGANGQPVLFNRKGRKTKQPRAKRKPVVEPQRDHADLLDALKGLGLATTSQAIAEAVAALYPDGLAGQDQGDVIRKVFLHLQRKQM
jgi:hypothetical protein